MLFDRDKGAFNSHTIKLEIPFYDDATQREIVWIRRFSKYILYILFVMLCFSKSAFATKENCQSMAQLKLPNTKIIQAEYVSAGDYTISEDKHFEMPEFCRVVGRSRPTSDSDIKFEVWMPVHEWTGRYYQIGNGGFAGELYYAAMRSQLLLGNAVAATDTGHQDSPFSAQWALGHPEKVIDYGYRSLKITSDKARQLIQAFYGALPQYAYYLGCSGGGRQALVAAQRFPKDWDGIIAGAPPIDFTALLTSFANTQHVLSSHGSRSYISPDKLPAIQRAALLTCNDRANVVNDIATNPQYCLLEPDTLSCKGDENNQCLTALQVNSLSNIITGPKNPNTGEVLIAGYEPALAETWGEYISRYNPADAAQVYFATGFFAHMVYDNPDWKLEDFDLKNAWAAINNKTIAGEALRDVLNATNANLSPFHQRKGKILMYLGWGDSSVPPRSGIRYYERVMDEVGAQRTQEFFRLYMAPGMTHCAGGPGPNSFGQFFDPLNTSDKQDELILALEAWVEEGRAPKEIVATKYISDNPRLGVVSTGLLCPHPQVAVYQNKSRRTKAENYLCLTPGDAP